MKKILFISAMIFAFFAANSQTLPTLYRDGVNVTNTTINIDSIGEDIGMLIANVEVKNESNQAMTVTLTKEVITEVGHSMNSFCFGQCVSPETMTFTLQPPLEPNASEPMMGEYYPDGNAGTTTVKYSFTTDLSGSEACYVIVNYNYSFTGINDIIENLNFSLFPNPMSGTGYLSFDMPQDISNGKVMVYSLTGSKVKEFNVNGGHNDININASEFNSGVYLISIISDNRVYATKKMVVL